ncbi:AAA family ATPase, partial [Rodentibacter pneumotropicus]
MHLKSFKVTKINGDIVREVLFHNGLNLIVGFPEDRLSTTNGLGKTTLLRCIDFCLAGEIKQLYEDPESKNKNEKVYQFLLTNNPSFTLIVEDENKSIISIERSIDLSKNKKKIINKINQKKYSNDEFKNKLSLLFFDNKSEKPSFRQLIPKFIRKDENQISNILKYLHPSTTNTSYEAIHSFLFGFNESGLLKEKIILTEEIKRLKNKKDLLSEKNKEHELEQLLPLLKKEIEELQEKRNTFQINEAYEKDEYE